MPRPMQTITVLPSRTLTQSYTETLTEAEMSSYNALWALQAYVGSRQLGEIAKKAADVNLDGEINTSDALAILQFAVKLRDKLPTV